MFRRNKVGADRGSVSVELMIVLPMLCMVLLCVPDIWRFAVCWTAVDQAATEAARLAIADPDAAQRDFEAAAANAAPQLDPSGIVVAVYREPVRETTYTHRLYDRGEPGTYAERPSVAQRGAVRVTVTFDTAWISPIGSAVGAASGMPDGVLRVSSAKSCSYDTTVTGGAW